MFLMIFSLNELLFKALLVNRLNSTVTTNDYSHTMKSLQNAL